MKLLLEYMATLMLLTHVTSPKRADVLIFIEKMKGVGVSCSHHGPDLLFSVKACTVSAKTNDLETEVIFYYSKHNIKKHTFLNTFCESVSGKCLHPNR